MHVLLEDNHLLAVQKPNGVLTQSDSSDRVSLHETAKEYLRTRYAKPGRVFLGIVHRLDRLACGVVLFARTSKSASRLSDQIRRRTVRKRYWAVVEGCPSCIQTRLEGWLVRPGNRSKILKQPSPQAQACSLSYQVLRSESNRSLLEIDLETGRKHQIRAQMASIGHPVLGDKAYGAHSPFRPDGIALLAHRFEFDHPTRSERIELVANIPADWPIHP